MIEQIFHQAQGFYQRGDFGEAERLCRQLLALRPADFSGNYLLAIILSSQGRAEEALPPYDNALKLQPQNGEVQFNRGNALYGLGRIADALAAYNQVIVQQPGFAPAWANRGNALQALGRFSEAVESYGRVLVLDPDALPIRQNRANLLLQMGNFAEALAGYAAVLLKAPNLPEAWLKQGHALRNLGRTREALASYARATELNPGMAEAWSWRGSLEWQENRAPEKAIEYLKRAVALNRDIAYVPGLLVHLKMMVCDWTGLEAQIAQLEEGTCAGKPLVEPFALVTMSQSPQALLACAENFSRRVFPSQKPLPRPARGPRTTIRIGYVAGEFYEHATAYLTAGLFERHDRSQFELVALDNGPDDASPMRRRLEAAFEKIIDIRELSGQAAAERVVAEGIDILVNLNGWAGRYRSDLFAFRPAPVQVNYLGFPGSMGAEYIDYIVADGVLITQQDKGFYSERIVWLPHSYQVNDDRRPIAPAPMRGACGLPEGDFVFGNFNSSHKFIPEIFACWMRLLSQVPNSVLWLLQTNAAMMDNLRREAAARGVDPRRLIFAPFVPAAENLARLTLMDLALDTLPYNAHTGASDLLWAGVPLVTSRGKSFNGRVAASLLTSVGLPELVTETLEDYEALALMLAREPERLAILRRRLAANRASAALFDTRQATRHLEAAYREMWAISQEGQPPRDFAVPSS